MPAVWFIVRRGRRFLAGSPTPGGGPPLRAQARRFTVAQTIVRAFYAYTLYFAVSQFTGAGDLFTRHAYAPLWPVAWIYRLPGAAGVSVLLGFYFATSLLGAFFVRWRVARLFVCLGLLEIVALRNSFGKVGHSQHLLVLVSAALIFLPPGWTLPASLAPRRLRQETLLAFWLAQTTILLSYTMSGLGKLGGALYQAALGERHAFLPGAFGAHIAQRLGQTGSHSTLGEWMIHHPYLTWPLLPGAVIFETFAVLAAFRPPLGRPLAATLILFHVGTYFTMTITFPQNCFLLAIFFFVSPFEPEILRWKNVLFALPLAHKIRLFRPSARARPRE